MFGSGVEILFLSDIGSQWAVFAGPWPLTSLIFLKFKKNVETLQLRDLFAELPQNLQMILLTESVKNTSVRSCDPSITLRAQLHVVSMTGFTRVEDLTSPVWMQRDPGGATAQGEGGHRAVSWRGEVGGSVAGIGFAVSERAGGPVGESPRQHDDLSVCVRITSVD